MKGYDPSSYPAVAVTVDLVVLTIRDDELCALLIRRGEAPYKGQWALPGGFVQPDENLDEAAARELHEETGLSPDHVHVEQLATYGAPRRDPRMRVVSVAHLALAPDLPTPESGSDAAAARWTPVSSILDQSKRLAFDHAQILADGLERARSKIEYTSLASAFCGTDFTIAELRRGFPIVWGVTIDARNFHRKARTTVDFLEPTGRTTPRDGGRPAQLYRRGPAELLTPPLIRPGHDGRQVP